MFGVRYSIFHFCLPPDSLLSWSPTKEAIPASGFHNFTFLFLVFESPSEIAFGDVRVFFKHPPTQTRWLARQVLLPMRFICSKNLPFIQHGQASCPSWYGTTFVKYYFSILVSLYFWRLIAWAASTMNQSDIRGLSRRVGTEPTLIFFVASFAFYGHEFSPSETNLSYRMAASSSVVPTLSSIMKSLIKSQINMLNKFSFGPSQEDQGRKKTVHSIEGLSLNPT